MGIKRRMDFCIECRKDTAYTLKKEDDYKENKRKKNIRSTSQ